jgi:hypothetical protein
MARSGRVWQVAIFASLLFWRAQGAAIQLDPQGDMRLGVQTYLNSRIGTEDTHDGPAISEATKLGVGTFPRSEAGHLRQNRFYIEAELNHDLTRLIKQFIKVKHLAYHLTFRGEGDSLYDWGGREYSTASDFYKMSAAVPPNPAIQNEDRTAPYSGEQVVNVAGLRHHLRQLGTDRERLFQAYVEGEMGNLFLRVGRQILSWGEADNFQLLDHINPLDSSFGGFLIPLDERRIPLDMVLANYYVGNFGPISEAYVEGFYAFDKEVGFSPGTPVGSAWSLPGLGAANNSTAEFIHEPALNFKNGRGGLQLKFNAFDATFSLAHYYTYFDIPAVQVHIHDYNGLQKGLLTAYNDGQPCQALGPGNQPLYDEHGAPLPDYSNLTCGVPVHAILTAPTVQVSGASTTFAVPQFYSVVRSEVAYFKDEPAFTQGQLDPFLLNNTCNQVGDGKPCNSFVPTRDPATGKFLPWNTTGGRRLRDSFNALIGIDMNQWIRILNPNQTFLISTQFFYKHIFNAAPSGPVMQTVQLAGGATVSRPNPNREVLPVQALGAWTPYYFSVPQTGLGPLFITQPTDQYLQTLFIGTSYRSGTISPGLTVFYDWGGAFLYQPSVTFSRDPFRFMITYSVIDAHTYKGGSGISLLKDRDNVEFRLEYVL